LRYLSNFAVIHGNEPKTAIRYRDASFLQLSKIVVPISAAIGTSPLPAGRSVD